MVRSWPALAPSPVRAVWTSSRPDSGPSLYAPAMPMASGSAEARSPPLRPAEATITVAIEKAHAVIPSAWVGRPAGAPAGHDATVAGEPTSCGAAGRPILAWAPGEDGPNSEKDNPQEPHPGGRRASPPAPGRLGPWGSSAPRGTPTAFPSLARESSRP